MLFKATDTTVYAVQASDGTLGTAINSLFDDASWTVRWLVVETGSWWTDHGVLIPASALGHPDLKARTFPVNLKMEQVKGSKDVDTHCPVSRKFEARAYDIYCFSPYLATDLYMGDFAYWGDMVPMAPSLEMERREGEIAQIARQNEDPNLRSVAEISGFHVHAMDGDIGHLSDVLIEDTDWSLRYLIVNTSNWWQRKNVLVSPRFTQSIRWPEQLIYLGVTRDHIRKSPEYDASRPVDRASEADIDCHYGPTKPATRPEGTRLARKSGDRPPLDRRKMGKPRQISAMFRRS